MPFVQPPIHFPGQMRTGWDRGVAWTNAARLALIPLPLGHASLRNLLARSAHTSPSEPSSHALRIIQTKGDGRCLFRAIAKCLAFRGMRPLTEHLERADADALRMAAYEQICLKRRQEFSKKGIIEGDVSSYCAALRSPEFYAGEAEMFVLAEVLETPIEVYLEQPQRRHFLKIVEYGSKYRSAKPHEQPVRVLYNGTNHYSALFPK